VADIGYALFVLALLNMIDWAVTHYGLKLGFAELNPIAAFILSRTGTVGLYTWKMAGVAITILVIYKLAPAELERAVWLLNAVFATIILWNSIQLYMALSHT
jgi:hypothetical protein